MRLFFRKPDQGKRDQMDDYHWATLGKAFIPVPLEVGEDLLTVEIDDQINVQRWLGQKKSTDPPSQAEQEILRLEEQRRQAILHNDAVAMDRLLGEEFIVTDVQGIVHDKTEEVALSKRASHRKCQARCRATIGGASHPSSPKAAGVLGSLQ